ncbi:hypothetical protein EPYR_00910 [Erwinia pyrifoliae DSM 12163]|nr:hypothetical protein CPI84_14550 [Erwinia pyrifoliae]MCA8876120.1 hypothetical protein [Erwinia pyrifoliae]CAX54640.1 conserved uncharacterized protein [Erwinia pyrifoliae Ep1/96]CAY73290.1 hypothetical protein EPYR_00910 [Erwinia pyrifoliae DSM 12163]
MMLARFRQFRPLQLPAHFLRSAHHTLSAAMEPVLIQVYGGSFARVSQQRAISRGGKGCHGCHRAGY